MRLMDASRDLDADELAVLCRELIRSWGGESHRVKLSDGEVDRLMMVTALGQHAYSLAQAYLSAGAEGLWFAGLALARACYETGLRAQWVQLLEDGPEAFRNEDGRTTGLLAADAIRSGWITDPATISALASDRETLPAESNARHVARMCYDLAEAGTSAYTLYRALSARSHPSLVIVDAYVDGDAHSWRGFRSPRSGGEGDPRLGLFPVACGLVWAGRAVDLHDPQHTRRPELRAAARALKIPDLFTLSPAVWHRAHRAP